MALLGQQDLDNFANAEVKRPVESLARSLNAATFGNPDQYAKDRQISKDTGVPADLVQHDREELTRKSSLSELDLENFYSASPNTMKWLENTPEGVRISYDDIGTLQKIEREANRSWFNFDKRTFDGLGDSMMIGLGKVYDQVKIAMLSDIDEGLMPEDMLEIYKASLPEGEITRRRTEREQQIKMHIESLRTAEAAIGELTPEGLTVAEDGFRGAVQMVADMAPGMLISMVTRGALNPTLALLTAKTTLDSYGSARMEGMGHSESMTYGGIDGILEFATERLPTKALEKILGKVGKDFDIKRSLKEWFYAETGGEQIASLTQSLNAYVHDLDEEMTDAVGKGDLAEIFAIQGRRQAVTFISTLAGGGSMSASIGAVNWLATADRRAQAAAMQKAYTRLGSERAQEQLDAVFYLAQNAKLNERDSDMFKDFLEKVAPGKTIYIGMEALEGMEDLPDSLTDQIDGSGADVQMSLADFVSVFGNDSEKMQAMRPHIKTDAQLMSQTEMELDTDSTYIKDLLLRAEQAQDTKDHADTIFSKIVAELKATGRQSELTSRQSAELYPAMVTTQYEDLKARGKKNEDGSEITVEQLFEDMGFRIAHPDEQVGKKGEDFLEQDGKSLFHVTFTKNLERIEKEGLALFEPSLWANLAGDRLGDAGIFAFESAQDALGWAQGQGFDFKESVSIIKMVRDDFWEEDPSQDMKWRSIEGRSMRRPGPVQPNQLLGAINLDDFGYAGPRDMSPADWAAEVVGAIQAASSMSQGERIEWANAVAKGLDMSRDARLDRAEEQGYDIVTYWFHGTRQDFDAWQLDAMNRGRPFIFVSADAKIAGEFAGVFGEKPIPDTVPYAGYSPAQGANIIPVFLKIQKTFDPAGLSWEEKAAFFNWFNRPAAGLTQDEVEHLWLEVKAADWETLEDPDIQRFIRGQGYDSFVVYEEGHRNVAVLNENQIRSIHAAFDPELSESPGVLHQQNFSTISISETVVDEAGNVHDITQSAQVLWDDLQSRANSLENLRRCMSA